MRGSELACRPDSLWGHLSWPPALGNLHLTFQTNTEVMQQAGLQLPNLMLVSLLTREGHRKHSTLDEHVCSPASSWWGTVMQSLLYKPNPRILKCILEPHMDDILPRIRRYPQFAYQQGRSQYDALRKVFAHCATVRAELSKHHKNLHQQHADAKPIPLFGSLMITVDLSQAFDKMPRELLYRGMVGLQLPADLIAIIMAWPPSHLCCG